MLYMSYGQIKDVYMTYTYWSEIGQGNKISTRLHDTRENFVYWGCLNSLHMSPA